MYKAKQKLSRISLKRAVSEKPNSKSQMTKHAKKSEKKEQREAKGKRSRYATVNTRSVLKELKNTATKSVTSVKSGLDHLSQRLRLVSPKEGKCSTAVNDYGQFENENRTPVKLYSPFTIATPSPITNKRKRTRCSRRVCDELTFTSPTGKLREDVSYVTSGLNELNIVTSKLKKQISYDNVAFNLMD